MMNNVLRMCEGFFYILTFSVQKNHNQRSVRPTPAPHSLGFQACRAVKRTLEGSQWPVAFVRKGEMRASAALLSRVASAFSKRWLHTPTHLPMSAENDAQYHTVDVIHCVVQPNGRSDKIFML